MGPVQKQEKIQLNVKTLTAIGGFCSVMIGGIVGIVAWVHAEVTVPQILRQTQQQTMEMMDRHERATHQGSFTQREFRLWSDQVLKRLESIERAVKR